MSAECTARDPIHAALRSRMIRYYLVWPEFSFVRVLQDARQAEFDN